MKETIAEQKGKLKEQLNQEIDSYYEEIEMGLKRKTLKIDGIERLLKEKKAKLNEMLIEATSEAVSEDETEQESKKNAPNVDGQCDGKTANRKKE